MEKSTLKFSDKMVWISGAAQGIGRGIAEHFAKEGAKVALVDVKRKEGENLETEINAYGGVSRFIFCDVGDEMSIRRSIEKTVDSFGDLHILVNNAAVNFVKPLHELSSEEWDWQMNINLKSCFLSFKYAYPHLKRHEASYVVNIGSVNSFIGQASTPGYNASKGALHLLTKSIAIDYAAEGIRCNLVCPGVTYTPMLQSHVGSDDVLRARLKRVPIGRSLSPHEIAKTVAYLSCDDSSGVTGTSIVVDGGYTATAEWNGDAKF